MKKEKENERGDRPPKIKIHSEAKHENVIELFELFDDSALSICKVWKNMFVIPAEFRSRISQNIIEN